MPPPGSESLFVLATDLGQRGGVIALGGCEVDPLEREGFVVSGLVAQHDHLVVVGTDFLVEPLDGFGGLVGGMIVVDADDVAGGRVEFFAQAGAIGATALVADQNRGQSTVSLAVRQGLDAVPSPCAAKPYSDPGFDKEWLLT